MGWPSASVAFGWVWACLSTWVRQADSSTPVHPRRADAGLIGPEVIVIGPSDVLLVGPADAVGVSGVPLIAPEPVIAIAPPARAAWDDRGWLESHDGSKLRYDGSYSVRRRDGQLAQFRGRIMVDSTGVVPYIADPPAAIKRHPKGPCFQLTQAPWFRVHWRRPAQNVDDALLYVERILSEVLR